MVAAVLLAMGVGGAEPVSLDGTPDEDVLQVLQLTIERIVFKHDVLEVSLAELLLVTQLRVLFSKSLNLIFELSKHTETGTAILSGSG